MFGWLCRLVRHATLFCVLIFAVLSQQAQAVPSQLVYQNFSEAVIGLHPKEVSDLHDLYEENRIIDLERSGLGALSDWLSQLNQRLTTAVESLGDQFPEYRISVIASNEADAYVYKFRIPGQRFYRGHVFFSSGFLKKMAESLGGDLATLTPDDLQQLLTGLQGVLAHEFAHPKQDELVKWEWRGDHDRSHQTHGQADEAATDVMSIRVLRNAHLNPASTLTGLELVLGAPTHSGNHARRAAGAVLSTHPEDKLRLNLVRGALLQLRREEGRSRIEPIAFNADSIREELVQIIGNDSDSSRLERIRSQAAASGESFVIHFLSQMLEGMSEGVDRHFSSGKPLVNYLDWFPLLEQVLAETPRLSQQETTELTHFMEQVREAAQGGFAQSVWMHEGRGSGADPLTYNFHATRRGQKLYAGSRLFANPAVQQWIQTEVQSRFWRFVDPNGNSNLHYLATLLPRDLSTPIYEKALNLSDSLPIQKRAKHYASILYGSRLMGGSIDLELKVVAKLSEVRPDSDALLFEFAKTMHNVFPDTWGMNIHRAALLERFQQAGERRPEMFRAWSGVFERVYRNPEYFKNNSDIRELLSSGDGAYALEIIQWNLVPADYPKPFKSSFSQDNSLLTQWLAGIFKSEAWQAFLNEALEELPSHGGQLEHEETLEKLAAFIASEKTPLNQDEREALLDAVLTAAQNTRPDSDLFKGRVILELNIIQKSGESNQLELAKRRMLKLARLLRFHGVQDFLQAMESMSQSSSTSRFKLFKDGNKMGVLLAALHREGLLDEAGYRAASTRYFLTPDAHAASTVSSLRPRSAYSLWRTHRPNSSPAETLALLRQITAVYRPLPLNNQARSRSSVEQLLQSTGSRVHPDYAQFFEHIRQGLAADFRRVVTTGNYADVTEFLKVVFNPDGARLQIEFRDLLKYMRLDGPAETMIPLIPAQTLLFAQNLEIWNILTAKRSNRHTDVYFEAHLAAGLRALPESERLTAYEEILSYGRVRSERVRNELLGKLLDQRIAALRSRASQLTDREVSPLIQLIVTRVPNGSRFRDDVLERLAWKLEFSEAQLHKFIEPLKSFNYRSINPMSLNLLSMTSVMLEKLSVQEKIHLVQYIQNRSGSLREALPWVDRVAEAVDYFLRTRNLENFDWMDHLESFVRDAGDGERLVLIELILGSRGVGLWYQGDRIRHQLYEMAGLEAGSTKRQLFEAYLTALPQHEHSITLSYLLATVNESGTNELLRIFEAFDTPGIKFAQMASVLGIFGAERSEELAQAKNRAMPPSRADIYGLLREHYSADQFAQIRRIRALLGSGSIKYVALIEFADGAREAVSIRRPHLDARIESTLEIAEAWAQELRRDPEMVAEYDFDYYLRSLRQQLEQEVQFRREHDLSVEMGRRYARVSAHRGWRFRAVPPSQIRETSDHLMHFMAVENSKPFKELTPEEQRAAGELIVKTELRFLLEDGIFDADRHMGNYLFDPSTKSVYVVDLGQTYHLQPNRMLRPGDPYTIAQMLRGLTVDNPTQGAALLTEAFLRIAEEFPQGSRSELSTRLTSSFQGILSGEATMKEKMFRILASLNRERVRIPLRFSMGVIKGLMIVLNEDYAQVAGQTFIQGRLEPFVRRELLLGSRFDLVSACERAMMPKGE